MRKSASEVIRNLEMRIDHLENGMDRTARSQNVEYTCLKNTPYYGVYNMEYETTIYKKGESGRGVLHTEFGNYVLIEEDTGIAGNPLFMVVDSRDFDIRFI